MKIIYNSHCDAECFNVLRTALFDYLRFLKSQSEHLDRESFISGVRSLLARLDQANDTLLDNFFDVVEFDFSISELRFIKFAANCTSDLQLKVRVLDELCQILLPFTIE